jgi:hypothetical protein
MDFRFARLGNAEHRLPVHGQGLFPAQGQIVEITDARLGPFWLYALADGSLVEDEARTKEIAAAIAGLRTYAKINPALDALRAKFAKEDAPAEPAAPAAPETAFSA